MQITKWLGAFFFNMVWVFFMGPNILAFQVGLDPASALSWLHQEFLSGGTTPWDSMVITILAHCSSGPVPQ